MPEKNGQGQAQRAWQVNQTSQPVQGNFQQMHP